MKKWLLGITFGFLLITGGCSDEAGIQEELTAVLENNTLLTTETSELHSTNENLLKTNEVLEKDYTELNEKHEGLTKKLAFLDGYEQTIKELDSEHKKNIEAFEKKITELKEENKELNNQIAAAEQKEKEIAAAKQKEVATASKQQNRSESGTSTSETGSTTAEVNQDCNIKGSSSGIYHIPGSTYYNRTTNPVAMFCSVEEAQKAGYRAPKR